MESLETGAIILCLLDDVGQQDCFAGTRNAVDPKTSMRTGKPILILFKPIDPLACLLFV